MSGRRAHANPREGVSEASAGNDDRRDNRDSYTQGDPIGAAQTRTDRDAA